MLSRSRPSHPSLENRSEAALKAGAFAKKKRREKQYMLQLTQQQLLQDRLVRDQLLEAAASKEREFVRLSGEVVAGRNANAITGPKAFRRKRTKYNSLHVHEDLLYFHLFGSRPEGSTGVDPTFVHVKNNVTDASGAQQRLYDVQKKVNWSCTSSTRIKPSLLHYLSLGHLGGVGALAEEQDESFPEEIRWGTPQCGDYSINVS